MIVLMPISSPRKKKANAVANNGSNVYINDISEADMRRKA
jgi:hypothetical protein